MLLRLWQNLQLLENALQEPNVYRMYSTIVTEGLNFAAVPPNDGLNPYQAILDIDQVRILSMSHKYDPSRLHVGLLIYSVDGQTDFVLNDLMLRIKTGDILIHRTHHALAGQEEVYRDLIRTLFGTHRINLVGLVFTFSGSGYVSECLRWSPNSTAHTTPAHPTEQKLIDIVIVTLYTNDAWLSMPMASHIDVETLSQNAKKLYLLKLENIEKVFNNRRQERDYPTHLPLANLLRRHPHHSSNDFRSFEWTPNRRETFDTTIQALLDEFYNLIQQTFSDGEFDRDQYAYFDDSTRQPTAGLAPSMNLVSSYTPLPVLTPNPYPPLPPAATYNPYSTLPGPYS